MLELIKKAAEGMYHSKGFNEEKDLQMLLFLWLEGACVANIAHCIFRTLLVLVIHIYTTISQILISPAFLTYFEVEKNIAACFEGLLDIIETLEAYTHAVLMFDELAIEKWP